MQLKIGEWLRGQVFLGFVIGLVSYIGLSILHVRYALLLAIIAGFCEMIPYIGPIFSAIPAAIIAPTPILYPKTFHQQPATIRLLFCIDPTIVSLSIIRVYMENAQ